MKIKVVSDGTPEGTKVVDENNEALEGLAAVKWTCYPEQVPTVILKFVLPEVELSADIDPAQFFGRGSTFSTEEIKIKEGE